MIRDPVQEYVDWLKEMAVTLNTNLEGVKAWMSAQSTHTPEMIPIPDSPITLEKIDHPSHYQGNKFEVIDIIEDFDLNFRLGNAIKYILRAGKKENKLDDINKAIWYLERECQKIGEEILFGEQKPISP